MNVLFNGQSNYSDPLIKRARFGQNWSNRSNQHPRAVQSQTEEVRGVVHTCAAATEAALHAWFALVPRLRSR